MLAFHDEEMDTITVSEVGVEDAFGLDAMNVGAPVALLGALRELKPNEELKLDWDLD